MDRFEGCTVVKSNSGYHYLHSSMDRFEEIYNFAVVRIISDLHSSMDRFEECHLNLFQ